MICKNCGQEFLEGKFCSECGNPLEDVVQDSKTEFPSLEELRATVVEIEQQAQSEINAAREENGIFYVGRAEYDAAVEKVDEFKKNSRLAFYLVFVSAALSFASFFSFLYLFNNINNSLSLVSMLSSYLNVPAIIISLISFAFASHWFLATKEYKFLKRPPFITWTFVLSIIGVVFTSVCFCMTTIPIMLF